MNTVSIKLVMIVGLLAGSFAAGAQSPQYTYGSELMSIEERLGHREIMRRLPPDQREIYRLERHRQMMDRAQALGYLMPAEPPEVRASAGRWIHSPSQAYKPLETEASAEARREMHSPGEARTSASAPTSRRDTGPRGYLPFTGYLPELPPPPTPPSPPELYGGPYGPSTYFPGPPTAFPGWYGPTPSTYGSPGY